MSNAKTATRGYGPTDRPLGFVDAGWVTRGRLGPNKFGVATVSGNADDFEDLHVNPVIDNGDEVADSENTLHVTVQARDKVI
jgi:hypothetical protein